MIDRTPMYEFVSYDDYLEPNSRLIKCRTLGEAREAAGKLAIEVNGTVDLARDGDEEFNLRYIATASPRPTCKTGYRLERL